MGRPRHSGDGSGPGLHPPVLSLNARHTGSRRSAINPLAQPGTTHIGEIRQAPFRAIDVVVHEPYACASCAPPSPLTAKSWSNSKSGQPSLAGSVSRLIEHAVRLFLRAPTAGTPEEPFELVTFGAGGRFSEHNLDKASALLEAEDVERYRDRR